VEVQQDSNIIKHFFRQSEMNALMKDCQTGLQEALGNFKVCFTLFIYHLSKRLNAQQIKSPTTLLDNLAEMQKDTQNMHEELLELISNLSDATISDRASSVCLLCWCVSRKLNSNSLSPN
jgi:hypothetical protein